MNTGALQLLIKRPVNLHWGWLTSLASALPRSSAHSSPSPSDNSNGRLIGGYGDDSCKKMLSSVIQTQIIPRLTQSEPTIAIDPSLAPSNNSKLEVESNNRLNQGSNSLKESSNITMEQVKVFAMLAVSARAGECQDFVQGLINEGASTPEVFLHLIGPAARFLGAQWEDDRVDFLQVTQGLVSMHEVTHKLGFEYQAGPKTEGTNYRIMLSCIPGSMHLLGPVMVSSFFRSGGWQVVLEISPTASELSHAVANEWFDVVGISVSTSDQLPRLKPLVTALKRSSRNPSLSVLAGGPVFQDTSLYADAFGLDFICIDPEKAVEMANLLASSRH